MSTARKTLSDAAVVRIGFIWAVFEAMVWFVLPDFFLAPAVVARPHLARRLTVAVTVGSTIGTICMIIIVLWATGPIYRLILGIPFVTPDMFTRAAAGLDHTYTVALQPFSGIPVKVWTWVATTEGYPIASFLALVAIGRFVRAGAVAAICVGLGYIRKRFGIIQKLDALWLIIYFAIFFASLYFVSYNP